MLSWFDWDIPPSWYWAEMETGRARKDWFSGVVEGVLCLGCSWRGCSHGRANVGLGRNRPSASLVEAVHNCHHPLQHEVQFPLRITQLDLTR